MIIRFLLGSFVSLLVVASLAPSYAIESAGERAQRKAKEAAESLPQGDEALAAKNWDLAISHYSKVIDAKAASGEDLGKTYFKRGLAHKGKNDCAKAIADYERAAETLTTNAELYFERYVCHNSLGHTDLAAADLDQAIKINPNSAIYRVQRCIAYFNSQNFTGAIPDCEMALSVAPEDQNMLLALSQSYEQTGNQAKALEMYRRLLKLNPGNATAVEGVKRLGG